MRDFAWLLLLQCHWVLVIDLVLVAVFGQRKANCSAFEAFAMVFPGILVNRFRILKGAEFGGYRAFVSEKCQG